MQFGKILAILGLVALSGAAALTAWLNLPRFRETRSHELRAGQIPLESGQSVPGSWSLKQTSPTRIPLGESGVIELELSAPSPGLLSGDSNVFDNYSLVAEARAEMAGANVSPSGISSQGLSPGSTLRFEWRLSPQKEGSLGGRVWLYFRFIPKDGGEAVVRPVSLQEVTIRSMTLFGRSAQQVRVFTWTLLVAGLLLLVIYLLLRFRAPKTRDL